MRPAPSIASTSHRRGPSLPFGTSSGPRLKAAPSSCQRPAGCRGRGGSGPPGWALTIRTGPRKARVTLQVECPPGPAAPDRCGPPPGLRGRAPSGRRCGPGRSPRAGARTVPRTCPGAGDRAPPAAGAGPGRPAPGDPASLPRRQAGGAFRSPGSLHAPIRGRMRPRISMDLGPPQGVPAKPWHLGCPLEPRWAPWPGTGPGTRARPGSSPWAGPGCSRCPPARGSPAGGSGPSPGTGPCP